MRRRGRVTAAVVTVIAESRRALPRWAPRGSAGSVRALPALPTVAAGTSEPSPSPGPPPDRGRPRRPAV